jgi:hypothetical protein
MARLVAPGETLCFSDTMSVFGMMADFMVSVSLMSAVIVSMAFINVRGNPFAFKLGKYFGQYRRRDVQLMEQFIKIYLAFSGEDFNNSFLQDTLVFPAESTGFAMLVSLGSFTKFCMFILAFVVVAVCFVSIFFMYCVHIIFFLDLFIVLRGTSILEIMYGLVLICQYRKVPFYLIRNSLFYHRSAQGLTDFYRFLTGIEREIYLRMS